MDAAFVCIDEEQPEGRRGMPREERASTTDSVLWALAHPVRRQILEQLSDGPKPFFEIANNFDMTRPAVRDHLYVLRDAGLVTGRGYGRSRRYALVNAQPLASVRQWLDWYEDELFGQTASPDARAGRF
jgi:DNA-binding transcriptional ArsR family regulator